MLSDQAPIYNTNGFLRVTLRSTEEIRINAGDTYLDQVLICCLNLCAHLCGKPVPTKIGSSPYKVDNIKMEQLYEAIYPTTGDVTMHFQDIEKALCSNKISTKKIIEKVICPMLKKIYKEIAKQKPAELQENNYDLN